MVPYCATPSSRSPVACCASNNGDDGGDGGDEMRDAS